MAQLMTASMARSHCEGAQMPAELQAAIEAAGLDWTSIWAIISPFVASIPWSKLGPAMLQVVQIEFGPGTQQQKIAAVMALIFSLFTPTPIPVPTPGPVTPVSVG